MEFRILGPPEVTSGAGPVVIPGRRHRLVLLTLLANAGQTVAVDRLVDALWAENPPTTARRQVQNCVASLRRLLNRFERQRNFIPADGSGYRIALLPGELDAQVFVDRVAAARSLATQGRLAEAVAQFRAALALWRGPALFGGSGQALDAIAARLGEQRLTALEQCVEAELRLGHHDTVAGELTELAAAHPLRERLVGQLMLAQYRCGRAADALRTYHRLRIALADELGIDPDPATRQRYATILGATTVGSRPGEADATAPAGLPAGIVGFTGRADELGWLDALLADPDAGSVPIAVLAGMAGVGKTALAVHWGHRVAARFPDGRLYLDLRGYDPVAPVRPVEADGPDDVPYHGLPPGPVSR